MSRRVMCELSHGGVQGRKVLELKGASCTVGDKEIIRCASSPGDHKEVACCLLLEVMLRLTEA